MTSSTPASASPYRPLSRLNVAPTSWELIWSHVHRVLVVNLGVAVADLPLLAALQLSHQPWRHPLLFGLLLLVLPGPALAAAFAYFDEAGTDGQAPARSYARAWRRLFAPAVRASAPFLVVLLAAVADIAALHDTALGAAIVPMAGVVALIAAPAWITALSHLARGGAPGRMLFLLAPYMVVRHALMSLFNLVLVAGGILLVNQAPLLGLAVVPGCVLFVVWHNHRTGPLLTPVHR